MQLDARRIVIETCIERCRDGAVQNLFEMGRWLNRAKAEGVVPHGQWEEWVKEHAGISTRAAQRYMQMAREYPEGSEVALLGTAKAAALLALPEGEREAFAREIDAANLTSREVEERVSAVRRERDEALRLVGEQKKRLGAANKERDAAVIDAIARTRSEVQRESREEIERLSGLLSSAGAGQRRTNELLDQARAQADKLRAELEAARRAGAKDHAQEETIRRLRAALEERERELDRMSEELDEAQLRAARHGMSGSEQSPVKAVLDAVSGLMAGAGTAPAQLRRVQGIDEETATMLLMQAQTVMRWAKAVCSAVLGEEHEDV